VQARRARGHRVLLVCSAVAGVTNCLTALAESPEATDRLAELLAVHRALGRELAVDEEFWLAEAESMLEQRLSRLRQDSGPRSRAAMLAMGEWLSTRIALCFLQKELDVGWVDAREALQVVWDEELSPARQWLSASCRAGADAELEQRWSALSPVLITQGFIGRTGNGETALLGRGGSDTSAALLAGRLSAEYLEIWTDVPGLFSADPRMISQARLLSGVDYEEALEMAASGARVIHPRCIRAADAMQIPVVIRDLNRRQVAGTRIGRQGSSQAGIKTITCQEDMAVFLLQNLDARHQVGFLAGVFDVIRSRGISVDLVATSETTTTIAVNCQANHLDREGLQALADDLGSLCKVRLFADCVCVNLVGHGARTALSRLQDVLRFFDDHPLLMVSQSANDLCLSLLVQAGDHLPILQGAHLALIPASSAGSDSVFGVSWAQLVAHDE